MSHPQLTISERRDNGQNLYEKVILKVARAGNPQYGTTYAFEGLDGFWGRKESLNQPTVGMVYEVLLATKRNQSGTGEYKDILELRGPAPEGTPTTELAERAPQSNGTTPAPQARDSRGSVDEKITRMNILNRWTDMLGYEVSMYTADPEADRLDRVNAQFEKTYELIEEFQREFLPPPPAPEFDPPPVEEGPEDIDELPW